MITTPEAPFPALGPAALGPPPPPEPVFTVASTPLTFCEPVWSSAPAPPPPLPPAPAKTVPPPDD